VGKQIQGLFLPKLVNVFAFYRSSARARDKTPNSKAPGITTQYCDQPSRDVALAIELRNLRYFDLAAI
jgi:hypothetical protein